MRLMTTGHSVSQTNPCDGSKCIPYLTLKTTKKMKEDSQKGKKVKFALQQATKAQTGSRGIALLFHDHGTRRG